ncbi:centrosomal protein of 120 kDa [Orussus abietinus]|uniref:centrosomal protein of 120 kDa n=1 Tax=Orussus abietinus TaxID=222816 RepID=UPI0006256A70|nr:centrosomal protein of 120 kDa [Orussus abietinus]
MEELIGPNLQVVLSIREGKGFDQIRHPIAIVATLNGNSLETDFIETVDGNLQYNTDLVWEADKCSLRKMRTSQMPLKVECFTRKENNSKEKIGYILLSLRSAQIITKDKEKNVKVIENKLLGVKNEFKPSKPELLITLTIEERSGLLTTCEGLSEINSHSNPYGNLETYLSKEYCSLRCKNLQNQHAGHETYRDTESCHVSNNSINPTVFLHAEKDYCKSVEAYHCYCLNIQLNDIKLQSAGLAIEDVEFRFHHPKAEIVSTFYPKMPISSGETLKLEDIGCKLHFISSTTEICHLLLSYPPKISVHDAGSNVKASAAQIILDVKRLFNTNKLECRYEAPLFDKEKNTIGFIDISMYLEDHGPYYRIKKKSGENLGPPILDDNLAYKIVNELETWKDKQQEMFTAELKRKEEQHLNLLSEEWRKRRESLETKLAYSVEQCKMLANSLNNATEDLRTRKLKSIEKEAQLIKANEELQWRYDHKLHELKTTSQQIQDELISKLNDLKEQNQAVKLQIEPLRLENDCLQQTIEKQAKELEMLRKETLTQDQTTSLLQELKVLDEKLNTAQKSKLYFKEQWGKAVREIHRVNMEHQQAMEIQIRSSKEELKNINVEDILCADSSALTNDQLLLDQIQKEIDVIKPKSISPSKNLSEHLCALPNHTFDKSNHNFAKSEVSTNSEERDKRLQMLLEERDSLMRTGSYAIDDAVIVKLNGEIRSLLISS